MNEELIQKLQYSITEQENVYSMPTMLIDSLRLINNYFSQNKNNKLCLVFPTKEFAAQWLSIPTVLLLIESNYISFKSEIAEAVTKYKRGDKLILNNEAVVEWVGKGAYGFVFKHKEHKGINQITIDIKKISKIQPAPPSRGALSSYRRVIESLQKVNDNPTDKLLGIQTEGNILYQKKSICLISKYISFENSISGVSLNNFPIDEYFEHCKIDDTGEVDKKSPLLISNNLTNLSLYLTLSNSVSKIIIDGYSSIQERNLDFNDIDAKQIPTILITDLSEVQNFESIGNYGFDFYNFSKENITIKEIKVLSPFNAFDIKIHKYLSFNLKKEICFNAKLEELTQLIHSIEKNDSVKEVTNLKILLIQLANKISRIAHPLSQIEIVGYKELISKVESLYYENRFYLGGSAKSIETAIENLKSILAKFSVSLSEKCIRLSELIIVNKYDYIICATDDEASSISTYLYNLDIVKRPKVISISEVNNTLLRPTPSKAILTGWVKSDNINRLLSSFIFSELTVLFYQFEVGYLNSLQNRNKRLINNVKSTINKEGILSNGSTEEKKGFYDLFKTETTNEKDLAFDIAEFELNLDNAQFSRYIVKGDSSDSIKAKRVDFKNDSFIYLTDTHSLLVLENFHIQAGKSLNIHKCRIENLRCGDVIAFIKTERELLNKIVEQQATPSALLETTRWIDLWKNLLKNHYKLLKNDFSKLIGELKERGCLRDQVTIRSWLFDDLKIGPRKDDDLISIAIMTNGTELYDNIKQVRAAIRQMTGWRMKASDYVIEQLKEKIKYSHSDIHINSTIDFEDLGEVEILEIAEIKTSHDNIDIRNVNRLLEKAKI